MHPSLHLDTESPVPLYHQLAEALRYRIATGALKPGAKLPPLRRAARTWNVNLHTVRRAYAELERLGVVETRVPQGTRVKSGAPPKHERSSQPARARFLRSIVSEARLRHGMSVDELVHELGRARTASRAAVSVVECSRTQCDDLAGQIEARFCVRADPRPIQDGRVPPPGVIVATYFHYNDVRTLWPERIADVRFLAIAPEPALAAQLGVAAQARRGSRRLPVVLCEKDEPMARNIAADLGRILPSSEFHLATEVVSSPEDCLAGKSAHTAVLLSPRLWGEMPAQLRAEPRVHQVRYVFDAAQLDALAAEQGWEAR